MASRHRRSHSASSSLDLSNSWHSSTKRAYSNHTTDSKWDEPWREGKRRRRREPSPQRNFIGPAAELGTTCGEFQLDRRRQLCPTSFSFTVPLQSNDANLQKLRAEAFWALHKTVTENGEGFVRRMRDYEHTRSRAEALTRAKEAQKRGRKRASISVKSPMHSDQSDEDDVQIVSGDVGPVHFSTRQKRAHSLNDDHRERRRSLSPGLVSACSSSSLSFTPALSRTTSVSTNSSQLSLSSSRPSYILTSASRTEKALAALSLAMANGAGSIEDYTNLQLSHQVLDDHQVGDMWN